MKSSARDYFFKACLCFLANEDLLGAKRSIENYSFEDPSFDTSKQKVLLDNIVNGIDTSNSDLIGESIQEYSRTWSLDKVCTKLLADVKRAFSAPEPQTVEDIIEQPLNLVDGGDEHEGQEEEAPTGGMGGGFDLT